MGKLLGYLRKTVIVLIIFTLVGLVVDYVVDKTDFPNVFTLFPLCLLIVALLLMLVVWMFTTLIQKDR